MTEYSDAVLDDLAEGERQKADELFDTDNDREIATIKEYPKLPKEIVKDHCGCCGRFFNAGDFYVTDFRVNEYIKICDKCIHDLHSALLEIKYKRVMVIAKNKKKRE